MADRWKNNGNKDILFLGSKITADDDCSCEIKRHLLLGRKVMTKLDSFLRPRIVQNEGEMQIKHGDYSHEIKRCLFLGGKTMANLDSILKSRDIALLTKVRLFRAMVFPVVMYGCDSWTIKKAEHQRIDAFELWSWRRLLRVPWTARRPNQSILKEISPNVHWKD